MLRRNKGYLKEAKVRTIYVLLSTPLPKLRYNITKPLNINADSILDVNFVINHPLLKARLLSNTRKELYYPEPSKELENQIRERDHNKCQICGSPGKDVDHIVPLEISHNNDPSNLRVLCRVCNLQRGRHCWYKFPEKPVQLMMGEFVLDSYY